MTVFFTSDTHFGHKRTLELSRRPFKDTEEMDEVMIANWNRSVGKTDIIYHLGDFGDAEKVEKLNGFIYFLPGNYDDTETIKRLSRFCEEIIFSNYVSWNGGSRLQLIHEPNEAINRGNFFLFGHIHKLQMVKRNGLNVGVDCHDFRPITLDTVLFYKDAIENHYDDNVFLEL